ncbi:DUF6207 family protein [Streptomyces sp. NPDC087512]|uniref:DUF6207 family protein n=1 Tax=Streptomyces sp. NPDC087512 TaxID=3155059 RepID=UPI003430F977
MCTCPSPDWSSSTCRGRRRDRVRVPRGAGRGGRVERTTRDAGQAGMRLRCCLDLRQPLNPAGSRGGPGRTPRPGGCSSPSRSSRAVGVTGDALLSALSRAADEKRLGGEPLCCDDVPVSPAEDICSFFCVPAAGPG